MQMQLIEANAIQLIIDILKGLDVFPAADENVEATYFVALRTLSILLETAAGVDKLLELNALDFILQLFRHTHELILRKNVMYSEYERALEILDGIADVLETIGENDLVQRAIVSNDLFSILLDFVDHRPTFKPPPIENLDVEQLSYDQIRITISKVVTYITMNDANMAELTSQKNTVARFKSWVTSGLSSISQKDEESIRVSGALCIGNLARSDDTCVALVEQHGVVASLLTLIKMEVDHLRFVGGGREEARSSIKVLHSAIGALKNLSLASANRYALGEAGTIDRIVSLFDFEHLKPIHYGCVGVLKNLTAGENGTVLLCRA
eukprot:jgi/Hompol1/1594/HPOL_002725-RA